MYGHPGSFFQKYEYISLEIYIIKSWRLDYFGKVVSQKLKAGSSLLEGRLYYTKKCCERRLSVPVCTHAKIFSQLRLVLQSELELGL